MSFPYKITLTYFLFSIAWIASSDHALTVLFDGDDLFAAQTYKSWFFVVFTSIMMLLFLLRETRNREKNEATLAKQRESISKLSQAVSQSPVSVIVANDKGRIEYVNSAFEQVSGYSMKEILDANPQLFDQGKNPQAIYDELWNTINAGKQWQGELLNRRKNGTSYWVYAKVSPVQNDEGEITHVLAIEEDITQRKTQENRIKHQANYDNLTELPNRFLAMDRMSQSINNAIRHDHAVVLMFIDLDDFKRINDSLGNEIGDQLISLAASRIAETVRQTDTVARYGGDEFLVILNHLDSPTDAPRVAEKLLSSLGSSFFIEGHELNITASIGMAIFPEDGQDPYELLRNADAAMFAAKDEGGNRYEFHSADVNEAAVERMKVEKKLRLALEHNELSLHYQPLVDMESGRIINAEVLLRWNNPELGLVPPEVFLPLAEATGLIVPIGEWVIQNSCSQLKNWHQHGVEQLSLMINISPRQFGDRNLVRSIVETLDNLELNGNCLELEITETLLLRNQDETRSTLSKLREKGIRIALDNFGSGHSSLSHLKHFPLDTLKIDRSSVGALNLESEKALMEGTLTAARGLGLKTVGEGVETCEQYNYLKHQGIDEVQGFLFTPALPADEFLAYYQSFKQPPSRDSEQDNNAS
ncbi:bifunctional diguanylate cyclase/phosphodiesterase [Motiliproteus sp. MSK22-1]|uniref:putative bifunctional diguanylate cyclase/phosphodiesterase n=1 Tax=Motiliproteus sp. MSK22-1 TaxID=1897630 RepID=UPI0009757B6B|nr:EAL domain-containing protein [Motiliproteus sp. MSK22-1]OMH30324.1 hypothetical protein BGP75_18230 [Motiliproteus sp. MSK22-1]